MQLNERLMPAGPWRYSADRSVKSMGECAAAVPPFVFLALAVGAAALSISLLAAGRENWGNLVATWVPSWLVVGLYNKLIELEEHEPGDRREGARGIAE